MPSIPTPCTNCLRFHYGACYEAPKQCRECGGFSHIERYCPNKKRVARIPGEPWPGTRRWCEMWGLDDDPELRQKVLTAIKTSPGCAIWVDGQCIHQGNESHFNTSDMQRGRGRPLEDRISRLRSRSPARDRNEGRDTQWRGRRRSRSPLRRYSPHDQRRLSPIRGRSPSYRRKSPSPYQLHRERPRSPRYATGSNAVVFEAKLENTRDLRRSSPVRFNNPQSKPSVPRYLAGPPLSCFKPAEDRVPLGDLSNRQVSAQNNERGERTTGGGSSKQPPEQENRAAELRSAQENIGRPPTSAPERDPTPEASFVEDPEFVLGVPKGATENEICDAYQQRMWEIDLERMGDGGLMIAENGSNLLDESVKILNAAKKQLVGY